ncbi:MAG: pseudouridine synthase [Bacteroidia bacterium]|nr:pseudouridine synthase [Bacteroidia bacterium]
MNEDSININKFISSKGLCSRREADRWIDEGRVKINGKIATKGNRVSPGDKVSIDGKPLKTQVKSIYIKFNKPAGVTCTTDRRDKSNIIDYLNFKERIFPIGRLDKNSTGLILLTNDGDIVNQVLRKENKHEKEYVVTVDKPITEQFINRMSKPIPMLGTKTLPSKVRKIKHNVFKIILTQGLNRQIRRMCEFCGYKAVALKRIRIMQIRLDDLKPGQWVYLSKQEMEQLKPKAAPQSVRTKSSKPKSPSKGRQKPFRKKN